MEGLAEKDLPMNLHVSLTIRALSTGAPHEYSLLNQMEPLPPIYSYFILSRGEERNTGVKLRGEKTELGLRGLDVVRKLWAHKL